MVTAFIIPLLQVRFRGSATSPRSHRYQGRARASLNSTTHPYETAREITFPPGSLSRVGARIWTLNLQSRLKEQHLTLFIIVSPQTSHLQSEGSDPYSIDTASQWMPHSLRKVRRKGSQSRVQVTGR